MRFLVALILSAAAFAQYDLVIRNGRVIDPESKLDDVRTVVIVNGKVAEIADGERDGRTVIDATGMIVAPGFIDLHAHGQDLENYRAQVMDGVTTALELEIGTDDIDRWYAERVDKGVINYGASIGHAPVRMAVMHDPGTFLPSGDAAHREATEDEINQIRRRIERGLRDGALAVGFGIQYTPAASRREILEMFRVAARFGAVCHVHMRYMGEREPISSIQGLQELIANTAITGAPLHLVHVTSSGLRATPHLLQMIRESVTHGLDISTECYPYTAAMTRIESAIFDRGWQKVLGINYRDLQWVATGERLTAQAFARYRKQGGMVIMHAIPEMAMRLAVTNSAVMIASDGHLENGKGHPRGAGTFSRVLGRFAHEDVMSWADAIRKMSLMPAQRLEGRAPEMRNKGRIRVGADADLIVFDPGRVIDRATFEHPALPSDGMRYVLVHGEPVVWDGKLVDGALPGRPVRGLIQRGPISP